MKVVVDAFNQEKALVILHDCKTSRSLCEDSFGALVSIAVPASVVARQTFGPDKILQYQHNFQIEIND